MQVEIEYSRWNVKHHNTRALLLDTASHLNNLLDCPIVETIRVEDTNPCCDKHSENCECGPMVCYRNPPGHGPYTIRLAIEDCARWSQIAYQFSHEFCHILSGYEKLKDNPNNWFHEAICELASVFTLRQMAKTWRTSPPYPQGVSYATCLMKYAQNRLSDKRHQLPSGESLGIWLAKYELELRAYSYLRDKNAIVAYCLLPLFEEKPNGWNAVAFLPESTGMLKEYLIDWYRKVDPSHKSFVELLAKIFSISVATI